MNIQHIRYFVVIAKYENISKAAQQLLVSQPALSNVLQQLEGELGTSLFDRQGKKLILNQAGCTFLQTAESVLRMLDESVRYLKDSNDISGKLWIGLHATCPELYEIIASFCRVYPDVQIKVSKAYKNMNNPEITPCDLALMTDYECGNYPHIHIATRQVMYAILPVAHPLANRRTLELKELANEYFCFVSPHGDTLEHAFQRCVEGGFVPKVRYIADSAATTLHFYLTQSCVGLTYNTNLDQYQRNDLALIPIREAPVGRTDIHLCLLQAEPTPVARLFFQYVGEQFSGS
ncbi:MAG: LysR family transcriptional regulator [Hungatella sp.]|nr:LysR family transcriptional regulator [Hungatella sp.]